MASDRPRPAHPWFAPAAPRVIAHRGLIHADGVLENTRAAFAAAVEAGAGYLESDCHLTADGVCVLAHDEDLSRLVGDPRRIDAMTLSQWKAALRDTGEALTLDEALKEFPTARFTLDVKVPAVAPAVGIAIADHAERVLVSSFSDRRRRDALAAARRAGARQRPATSAGQGAVAAAVAATRVRSLPLLRRALRGIDALQVPESHAGIPIVTPALISDAHAVGVEVHVWTVNDPDRIRALLADGVDGIVTDRADLALEVVRARLERRADTSPSSC